MRIPANDIKINTSRMMCSINVGGRLMCFDDPQIMGILNVTPDSFYAASRMESEESVRQRAIQIVNEGASIIDVGAYSTRPGSSDVSEEEEAVRLRKALTIVREAVPDAIISVDTFRASIARMCVTDLGANIINDVSGGDADGEMFATVAELGVPYILTHIGGTVENMHSDAPLTARTAADDVFFPAMMAYFTERVNRLHALGAKDVIIDPGFGFGKSINQNYDILFRLEEFKQWGLPVLAGVSRKSMIYRLLDTDAAGALNGTTVCHTIALLKGADILRVHDVKACREAIAIVRKTFKHT